MTFRTFRLIFVLSLFMVSAALADNRNFHEGRGNPWEYDAGPEKNSEWLRLFASTPNYRGIGQTVLGMERFRWHWGPVFYRGRLGKNEAKVLVIGQEGAQDEALSNRSFTGGTGQKMQNFLNYIGINESYLFLNTFVYCIFGQYRDENIENAAEGDYWMAQSPNSSIVKHRHQLLNHALTNNDLRLVVSVGSAARDTLVTWIESRGGICEDKTRIQTCDTSVLEEKIKLLAVPHPGGAGQVETEEERREVLENLRQSFQYAANLAAEWMFEDPLWLPKDETAERPEIKREIRAIHEGEGENQIKRGVVTYRFAEPFRYKSAPIPYRDFSFGFNWRLGVDGTSSNRGDRQRSVKIFSDRGIYDDKTVKWETPEGSSRRDSGYMDTRGDLPFEPPRVDYNAYDRGPGKNWARLLMGGKPGFEWPDFNELGVTSDKSFGTGPIYRGRFDQARVLIVADQESHDDMFTGRALSGNGGQKIQHFLNKLGITHSYVIIRTLPVDTLDFDTRKIQEISQHPQVVKVRSEILSRILAPSQDKVETELILTFGPHAEEAIKNIDTHDLPLFHLKTPFERDAYRNWNWALSEISKVAYTRDRRQNLRPYDKRSFKETRLEINRYDLPIHTERWVGTSGSLATRAINNPEHYKMTMPLWASRLPAPKLTESEREGLKIDGWDH